MDFKLYDLSFNFYLEKESGALSFSRCMLSDDESDHIQWRS